VKSDLVMFLQQYVLQALQHRAIVVICAYNIPVLIAVYLAGSLSRLYQIAL